SDGNLETLFDGDDLGLAVRVVVDGTWGFASGVDLTQAAALRAAGEAVEVAKVAAAINAEPIEHAGDAAYGDVSWVTAHEVDRLCGLGLPRRAGRAARAAGREAGRPQRPARPLRPGHRPQQPVAGHPRVDRPRDRTGPGARLRGRVRGHLVRYPGQARRPAV